MAWYTDVPKNPSNGYHTNTEWVIYGSLPFHSVEFYLRMYTYVHTYKRISYACVTDFEFYVRDPTCSSLFTWKQESAYKS